ncbi:E3 ubiquitin-protein ligase HERC4 [Mytilus galloprovincialis]|uniref:E3 ubiquitin-protein ligase HERC4 n=1 Tax=Mytilus galloprovincialis TaxID=29158 RepID=A0A8B6ETP7_MYTGA|nr:E3 ubiquitin-protein ligase HERC4 [Mytilus galloprovincialis]
MYAALELSKPLAQLFNKSIREAVYPETWKLASVIPVFKSGDRELVSNYRPISLLSIIENDEPILSPKEVKLNFDQEVKDIVEISCSEGHTLIVTSNGSCYACGCNDYGQIGHDSANKLGKVSSLNNQKVMSVVAGSQHSLALTEAGEVFSWGDNSCGQLGRGKVDENQAKQPKVIKTLVTYHIIQICSGNNHSLALSNDGIVFSWGANNYGQLGTGSSSQHMDIPQPLLSIRGIPVSQIIAGGNHCFILSMSGALFGWGRNSFGQLGVNDENDRNHPTQCKSLRQQRTVFVSCGEDHTCTLTQEGGVFTFGCGSHGQLGHDNTNNEILPRRVMDMMGTVVTQIACGSYRIHINSNKGNCMSSLLILTKNLLFEKIDMIYFILVEIELDANGREKGGELFCLRCHDKMGIPICGACRRPIEERVVHALGKAWHVDGNYVFRCYPSCSVYLCPYLDIGKIKADSSIEYS